VVERERRDQLTEHDGPYGTVGRRARPVIRRAGAPARRRAGGPAEDGDVLRRTEGTR
jgi:hypothetical protein